MSTHQFLNFSALPKEDDTSRSKPNDKTQSIRGSKLEESFCKNIQSEVMSHFVSHQEQYLRPSNQFNQEKQTAIIKQRPKRKTYSLNANVSSEFYLFNFHYKKRKQINTQKTLTLYNAKMPPSPEKNSRQSGKRQNTLQPSILERKPNILKRVSPIKMQKQCFFTQINQGSLQKSNQKKQKLRPNHKRSSSRYSNSSSKQKIKNQKSTSLIVNQVVQQNIFGHCRLNNNRELVKRQSKLLGYFQANRYLLKLKRIKNQLK